MVRKAKREEGSDNNATSVEPGDGGSSYSGRARTSAIMPSAALRSRIPESIDVFGFSISPGQFLLVQIFATFMLGFHGCTFHHFMISLIDFSTEFLDFLFS